MLRRAYAQEEPPEELRIGSLIIDFRAHEVWRDGEPIDLTPKEFRLLETLAREPVRELTRIANRMEQGDLSQRVRIRTKDEMGVLAHAFNTMADGLVRSEQLRRNLVSDVAHELRTPLTNIRGYLEALKDRVIEPSSETITSLYEESLLLSRLVVDLPNSAPESPCASAMGMKGAFLCGGKGTGAMQVKNVCS
jgi:signal transduction histidine kinase